MQREADPHPLVVSGAKRTTTTDRTVKGTTTFVDLLGWGVSQATIEKVLGTSMPAAQVTKIKD